MEICCDIEKLCKAPQLCDRFDSYVPDPAVLGKLRAVSEPMTVAIIFGFWCGDSRRIVPEVLKALTVAGNENLQLLAASVPYEETDHLPLEVGGLSVRKFPTVVFLRGRFKTTQEIDAGAEVCRFVEESLEAKRLDCLSGAG
jgi:hypothetical protein